MLTNKLKDFLNDNSTTILTGMNIIGVIGTAVLAAKETPKAIKLIEEKENYKKDKYGYSLTRLEKILFATPAYLPAILTGTATITCVLAANHIHKVNQNALRTAYISAAGALSAYKDKVNMMFGENAQNVIESEIEKDKELYFKYIDLHETKLFYEPISNRYFEMSLYEFKECEYKVNRMFNFLGGLKLNDIYEFIGLSATEYGEQVGWAAFRDWEIVGYSWIEMKFEEIETKDGLTALSIQFNMEPTADYLQWY